MSNNTPQEPLKDRIRKCKIKMMHSKMMLKSLRDKLEVAELENANLWIESDDLQVELEEYLKRKDIEILKVVK